MPKLKRKLKVVETIQGTEEEGEGQEKPILDEFLKMAELPYTSTSVNHRLTVDNLREDFLDHVLGYRDDNKKVLRYRYIHISAHGNGDSISIDPGGPRETKCKINSKHVLTHKKDICKKPLRGSLITLSACGSLLGRFSDALAKRGADAVIRPLNRVGFSESAMFIILFYFMLSVDHRRGTYRKEKDITPERIAEYIDIFQRTKAT